MKNWEVRATQKGYFGCIRKIGDTFFVPEGQEASWWERIEQASNIPVFQQVDRTEPVPELAVGEVNPSPATLGPVKQYTAASLRKFKKPRLLSIAEKLGSSDEDVVFEEKKNYEIIDFILNSYDAINGV